eukprot:TRINITY_DN2521_c0_g1_i1.p1 TRINITY_DN2521_c0_g1~~TRINITY_DN2521_c0_g1_i1.p1  ORF type:complete len:583 (-),score=108.70 TRINITY_DN2521_c0_g1_i1:395-2143(-)
MVSLLFEHLECVLHIYHVSVALEERFALFTNTTRNELSARYPIRSRITAWMEQQMQKAVCTYNHDHKDEDFAEVIASLQRAEFAGQQQLWFLQCALEYHTQHRDEEERRLAAAVVPARTLLFHSVIWRPSRWVVTRVDKGHYRLLTHAEYCVPTSYLGWRLMVLLHRVHTWLNNALWGLIVANMWQGPLGVQAMFRVQPYSVGYDFDYRTGKLVPSPPTRHTFLSRIRAIWKNISESRAQFESKPDTGLLGKSASRIFNIVWNYGAKGTVGTSVVALCQPTLTAVNLMLSSALAIGAVAYVPAAAALAHCFHALVYDPHCRRMQIVPLLKAAWKVLGSGVLNVALSAACCAAVHPAVAAGVLVSGLLKYVAHSAYDTAIYATVLRPLARVPSSDTFAARRIAGPGLSSSLYFQIEPSDVMALLQLYLEQTELDLFHNYTQKRIQEPMDALHLTFAAMLEPLGAALSADAPLSKLVDERQTVLLRHLELAVRARREALPRRGDTANVKVSRKDLRKTVAMAAVRNGYCADDRARARTGVAAGMGAVAPAVLLPPRECAVAGERRARGRLGCTRAALPPPRHQR